MGAHNEELTWVLLTFLKSKYTCTFPPKNTTFLKMPFLGEECRSVNFRPNDISTMLLHSKKSQTNQLGFTYFKALRSINLSESGRCLLLEI